MRRRRAPRAQVAEGVSELKNIALDMRDEVKIQSSMVDEITSKVDSANVHLNSMNKRMKKTLESTRSADRFILDFILLVILLGIVHSRLAAPPLISAPCRLSAFLSHWWQLSIAFHPNLPWIFSAAADGVIHLYTD